MRPTPRRAPAGRPTDAARRSRATGVRGGRRRGATVPAAWPLVLALAAASSGLVVPAASADRGGGSGGDDARARASARCGVGARTRLELRARDGRIRLDWDLERGRAGERWRVVVVREAALAGRRVVRLGRSGAAEVRLVLRDLEGADRVEVRASGPRGTTCAVGTTLHG